MKPTISVSIPEEDSYTIEHQFTSKGVRIVHVRLNNQYTLTYSVTVR